MQLVKRVEYVPSSGRRRDSTARLGPLNGYLNFTTLAGCLVETTRRAIIRAIHEVSFRLDRGPGEVRSVLPFKLLRDLVERDLKR